MSNEVYKTVDQYILQFPSEVQVILQELRKTIMLSAPEATEKISWGMPTFVLNGNLVHFAAHKQHIGFYPSPSAIDAFKDEISGYNSSKGAVQLPFSKPLPFDLVARMVKFRVDENKAKVKIK